MTHHKPKHKTIHVAFWHTVFVACLSSVTFRAAYYVFGVTAIVAIYNGVAIFIDKEH